MATAQHQRSGFGSIATLLLLLCWPTLAGADWDYCTVQTPIPPDNQIFCQPGGAKIPVKNAAPDLDNYFGWCSETINMYTAPSLVPETFYPSRTLKFKLTGREAGYRNLFGWYNVGDDVNLEQNRHVILFSNYNHNYAPPGNVTPWGGNCGNCAPTWNNTANECRLNPAPANSEINVDICNDPNWKHGPIGFFIVTPEGCNSTSDHARCPCWADGAWGSQARNNCADYKYIYYTEPRLNTLEQSSNQPYIHHLVYQSSIDPTWFYFGFEDLYRGGDNDFEDILVRVEGLHVNAPGEICNGEDDDCDGLIDENVTRDCSTTCGAGVELCLRPSDPADPCYGPHDPDNEACWGTCSAPQPTGESCNGADDDCDGEVDEGLTQACTSTCGNGIEYCVNSSWYGCTAAQPTTETCDNIDNDCDQSTDEELSQDCSTACGDGHRVCHAGQWAECDAPQPSLDICDGIDNDCDLQTDEDDPQLHRPCGSCGVEGAPACQGLCHPGEMLCLAGPPVHMECIGAVNPALELCDGYDNDCDSQTDEGFPLGQYCFVQQGMCSAEGTFVCDATGYGVVCNAQLHPVLEICNGMDDDCDGSVDESDPLMGLTCGSCGVTGMPDCLGICAPGTLLCSQDLNPIMICTGEILPLEEVCDVLDNDCDSQTDENALPEICDDFIDNDCDGLTDSEDPDCNPICTPGQWEYCGSNVGECRQGTRICSNSGTWGDCEGEIGPSLEICDEKDNNCDGQTDENATPEICDDGIDNDCDGLIDAHDPDCAQCTIGDTRPCGTDVGECRRGLEVCNTQANWNGDCVGEIRPQPESCDGMDNDCDGLTDEGSLCSGYNLCLCGTCSSACSASECPGGGSFTCVGGWCVSDPCCGVACPSGEQCDVNGNCADPCVWGQVQCQPDQVCRLGECVPVDCLAPGHECPQNQRCVNGICEDDPCSGIDCPTDQYCHEGSCLSVGCTNCRPDQICVEGGCTDSPCALVVCEIGQVCVNGECAANPCVNHYCQQGMICVNGQCVPDPCLNTRCPENSTCKDGYCVGGLDGGPDGSDGETDSGNDAGVDGGGEQQPADSGSDTTDVGGDQSGKPDTGNGGGASSGCGCSNTAQTQTPLALFLLLPAMLVFRRRRKAWTSLSLLVAAAVMGGCSNTAAPASDGSIACSGPEDCQQGYVCVAGDCRLKPPCTDFDGDGFCSVREGGEDCNDNRANVFPGAPELCDGVDNNCNGELDEECACKAGETAPCGLRIGICRPGTMTCSDGAWGECQGGVNPEPEEICGDMLDNNCSGSVDEGCSCPPGQGRSCGSNVGVCTFGFQTCVNESGQWVWTVCSGGTPPSEEICADEQDNDCDGAVDEGCDGCRDGAIRPCGLNVGICRPGKQTCHSGVWSACENAVWPQDEICDGLDNNCNRLVDEGCSCVEGAEQVCGSNIGECQKGVQSCVSGAWGECAGEVGPAQELCDGRDNDCDQQRDEDFSDLREPCFSGLGICKRVGIMICNPNYNPALPMDPVSNPGTICSATPGQAEATEKCDGLDNDCDGETDEGFDGVGQACSRGQGQCLAAGTTICGQNGGMDCTAVPGNPSQELCDGLDNDCDGYTDENFSSLGRACSVGEGICKAEGVYICSPDMLGTICNGSPGVGNIVETYCDGLDDDCNGLVDDNLVRDCSTICGVGQEMCVAGNWIGCTAPQPMTEVCDGMDNDCDGSTDEGFVDGNGTYNQSLEHCGGCYRMCNPAHAAVADCSTGVCQIVQCAPNYYNNNGSIFDGCEYFCDSPSGTLETCNGEDDDCDGLTDEEPMTPTTNCLSQGVCSNVTPVCSTGQWRCNYPSTYQGTETLCDNLNNDCDDQTDEGFSDKNTPCFAGLGVCRRNGVMICNTNQNGTICNAQAGSNSGAESCNGLDDDCDGSTDEEIPVALEMVEVTNGTLHFWMDRWEASRPDATADQRGFNTNYPCSRTGVRPWDDINWDDAKTKCEARTIVDQYGVIRNKRLCTDDEWKLACGETVTCNYPYNYIAGSPATCADPDDYDSSSCNTNSSQVVATGTFGNCISGFSVTDLSGNVAEWADCANPRDCRTVKPFFGGKFDDTLDIMLSCWFRNNAGPNMHLIGLGFRCCLDYQ